MSSSNAVRVVALTTALETLLIQPGESLGKKVKLVDRVPRFPELPQFPHHVGAADITRLYGLRSGCVHAGRTEVEKSDERLASMAVAQCLGGLLDDATLRACRTLSDVLVKLIG